MKSSKIVKCEVCGKSVHSRGLIGHMKLKDHVPFLKMTRVKDGAFDNSSCDSSQKDYEVSSSQNEIQTVEQNNAGISTDENPYACFQILEKGFTSFQPNICDWLKYFRKNPERGLKEWERIKDFEKKYYSPILINPEKYRALQRLFDAI